MTFSTLALAQDAAPPPGEPRGTAESRQTPAPTQDVPKIEGDPQAAGKLPIDLSSPRATMRTFLVAVQDAGGDHPERIDDAVACLDTSELEGADRAEQARARARRLAGVIDKKGVKVDDIPEEPAGDDWLFLRFEPSEGITPTPEIRLARDLTTGDWRFTSRTLKTIPALEESILQAAVTPEPTNDKVPASRRTARATMATFIEAMAAKPHNFEEAVKCLDPAWQDPDAWSVRGKDLAIKLKNVMDKIKLVVLPEIPDMSDAMPYVWHTSEAGNIVIERITEGELQGEWRFSPKTVKALDALYLEFEDKPIIAELREAGVGEELTFGLHLQRQMPEWLRVEYLGLQGWQWLALAALLVIGWPIKVVFPAIASLILWLFLRQRKISIDRDIQRRALRSSGAVAAVLFWYLAVRYAQLLQLPEGLLGFLLRGLQFAFAITAVWLGYRVVDIVGGYIARNADVRLTHLDEVLIPLLRKILRVVVVLVVVIFMLQWSGGDWTAVLGALGVGGVALAFAAQDTLGNFFGSITVLFDRPFGIGDWIVMGDVEGTVEHVGFRSTRVRTFYNSVITVPNSKMVNTQVDNYGVRRYRRAKITLAVTYSTPPEKIEAFCEGIRELIRLHPYTRKDYYHVYFNKFSSSSLDILLYTFFEAPDWSTELRERHRLFLDILRLAKRLDVKFAFPTQTVWLERARKAAPPSEIPPDELDPDTVGMDEAARLFEDRYGAAAPRPAPVVIDTTPRSKRRRREGMDAGGERS